MKRLITVNQLRDALSVGLVAAAEPDGTYRYLTTQADVLSEADRSFIVNSPAFDSSVDMVVYNLLDRKAERFQPTLYNGVMLSLEVSAASAEQSPVSGDFIEGVNTHVYVAGAKQEAVIVDEVGGPYPYVISINKPDGDVLISQVNAAGISRDGEAVVQAEPQREKDELILDVAGVLLLTKEKGPVFMSGALATGMIDNEQAPEIRMEDGSVAMSAIQRVHRDHGVLGYDFGQGE